MGLQVVAQDGVEEASTDNKQEARGGKRQGGVSCPRSGYGESEQGAPHVSPKHGPNSCAVRSLFEYHAGGTGRQAGFAALR